MSKCVIGALVGIMLMVGSGCTNNKSEQKMDYMVNDIRSITKEIGFNSASSIRHTDDILKNNLDIKVNNISIDLLVLLNSNVLKKLARLEKQLNEKPKSEYEFIRQDVGSKVVTIKGDRSGGSGFFVTAPSGKTYIMTNRHICKLRSAEGVLNVKLEGGDRFVPKKVIEVFKSHDLCLVEGFAKYKGLSVGSKPETGSVTYTVGHPKLYPLIVSKGQYIGSRKIKIAIFKHYRTVLNENVFSVPLASGYPKFRYESYNTSQIFGYSRGGSSGSPIVNQKGEVVSVLFAGNNGDNMDSYGVPYKHIVNLLKTY